MIEISTVERIHNILIDRFGGSKGIRDSTSLKSALARPFATYDQKDLYPEVIDKAAALFESMIINHPFMDGNKRISYVLMRLLLLEGDLDIDASQEEKYNFVLMASKGEIRYEEIKDWITNNSRRRNESAG